MTRGLKVDPADAVPIWKQIEEGVRRMVAIGTLEPGTAVPSVRDLAKELRVNPATVARAYQRLTDEGLLSVRRGDGTYVSDAPPEMPKGERTTQLRDGARKYATVALTVGADRDEAKDALDGAWDELRGKGRGTK